MATAVEADLVVSAWLVAMMLTLAGLGIMAGAVYMPALDIVPSVELPPVTPPTVHMTAVFVEFATLAENWKVCPTVKDEGTVPSVIVTAAGVVWEFAAGFEWQPTITISRLRLMPTTHAVWPRERIVESTPIQSRFRFDSCDINDSSECRKLNIFWHSLTPTDKARPKEEGFIGLASVPWKRAVRMPAPFARSNHLSADQETFVNNFEFSRAGWAEGHILRDRGRRVEKSWLASGVRAPTFRSIPAGYQWWQVSFSRLLFANRAVPRKFGPFFVTA
jgi:hypothetical protein